MPQSFINPDRLRRIDSWIGVPVCAMLTMVRKAAALVSAGRPTAPPRNVLFIELAEMGTTVLAAPAVQQLRARYPDCKVFFLLFKHIDASMRVLDITPDEQVLTIDVSNLASFTRDSLKVLRQCHQLRIDTVINLEMFARFSSILSYLSGARTRVGFHAFTQPGLYCGNLLTHRVLYNPHLHTWQSLRALVDALDEPPGDVPFGKIAAAPDRDCVVAAVTSSDSERAAMWNLVAASNPGLRNKRLVVVNPNASKLIEIRKWPLPRYAELVERLLADPANACVLTGIASEHEDAQFIVDRVKNDRLVNLVGKTSLRQLIDLFNIADVLVSNDSGPAHFAALTGIHIVVFFGPETPVLYRPLSPRVTTMYSHYACSPCVSAYNQRKSACTDNRCLQVIGVDEVHQTVVDILNRGAKAR